MYSNCLSNQAIFLHDQKVKTKINYVFNLIKAFFSIFKGLFVVKNCLRPESAPLSSSIHEKAMFSFISLSTPITLYLHSEV